MRDVPARRSRRLLADDRRRPGRRRSASASTSPPARCCRRPPTARRSACSTTFAPSRTPGSSSGSTTRRSRRPTGSTPSRAERGEPWLDALRRQDLVGVVLRQGAPDPRRGARGLRARRPADRGRRLGRLAAHRRRDAQQLHRRLQGDVVEARRLPDRRRTSPRSTRGFERRRRREAVARRSLRSARGGRAHRASRRRGRACVPGPPVAVANVDAHVSVPAATVTEPGTHGR